MKRGRGRGRVRPDNTFDRRRRTGLQTLQGRAPEQRRTRSRKDDEDISASNTETTEVNSARRSNLFKSFCPTRTPYARATFRTHTAFSFKHYKFTKGDIISVVDELDNKPYFAQIRGIISDPTFQPYAALTWLGPKRTCADAHVFHPEQFVHAFPDKKLYHFKHFNWISTRPRLPSYVCDISERKIIADNIIRVLRERLLEISKLAEEELKTVHRSPVDFMHKEKS